MTSLRRLSIFCLLALGGLAIRPVHGLADEPDGKDVLKFVPADAWAYAYVPSLAGLNDGINMIQTEAMGMAMMDAMQFFTMQLGIEKGLDNKGSAAIILLDMKKNYGEHKSEPAADKKKAKDADEDADDDEKSGDDAKGPPIAMVLPATDPKELLGNFSPGKEEDGIVKCEVHGEASYAHVSGNFVIMSPRQAVLKAILESKENVTSGMSAARKKLMAERSVTIAVAVHRLIEGFKDQITGYTGMMAAAMGPQAGALGKQVEEGLKVGRQLAWADITLGIDKNGVSLTFTAIPQSGSDLESKLRAKTAPAGSLLQGLPGDQYLVAFGAHGGKTKESDKDVQGMLEGLMNNPQFKSKLDPDKFKAFVKKAQGLSELTGNLGIAVSSLSDGPGGLVTAAVVITTTDSARLMDGISSLLLMLKDLPSSEEDRAKIAQLMKHTSAAETVESAKVDHIAFDMSKADASEDDITTLKKVVGEDGLLVRLAAADDKHVVLGLGGGQEQFAKMLSAAKKGEASLARDPGIQKAAERLPSGRMFEMYISPESIMKLVNRVARAKGEDAPISKVPTIDTPVSLAASTSDGTGRFDLVVPMPVIKGVRQAVTEASMGGHRKAKGDAGKGKKDKDEGEDEDNGKDDGKGKDKDKSDK